MIKDSQQENKLLRKKFITLSSNISLNGFLKSLGKPEPCSSKAAWPTWRSKLNGISADIKLCNR